MLEGVVRPYQSPDVASTGKIPVPATNKTPDIAHAKWGGSFGTAPTVNQDGLGFTVKKWEQWKETKRKTRKIRVENPDDSSQFVMVERPETMGFAKRSTFGNNTSDHNPGEQTVRYSGPTQDAVSLPSAPDYQPSTAVPEQGTVDLSLQQGDPPQEPVGFPPAPV